MELNVNNKGIIVTAAITILLVVNGILIHQRLEGKFYQKGLTAGVRQVGDRLVQEINAKGQITLRMPNGQTVTLAVTKATAANSAPTVAPRANRPAVVPEPNQPAPKG